MASFKQPFSAAPAAALPAWPVSFVIYDPAFTATFERMFGLPPQSRAPLAFATTRPPPVAKATVAAVVSPAAMSPKPAAPAATRGGRTSCYTGVRLLVHSFQVEADPDAPQVSRSNNGDRKKCYVSPFERPNRRARRARSVRGHGAHLCTHPLGPTRARAHTLPAARAPRSLALGPRAPCADAHARRKRSSRLPRSRYFWDISTTSSTPRARKPVAAAAAQPLTRARFFAATTPPRFAYGVPRQKSISPRTSAARQCRRQCTTPQPSARACSPTTRTLDCPRPTRRATNRRPPPSQKWKHFINLCAMLSPIGTVPHAKRHVGATSHKTLSCFSRDFVQTRTSEPALRTF